MKRPKRLWRGQLALALDHEAKPKTGQLSAAEIRQEVVKVLAELLLEALVEPGTDKPEGERRGSDESKNQA